MRLVVLGAQGRVGAALMQALGTRWHGHEVVAAARRATPDVGLLPGRGPQVKADLNALAALLDTLDGLAPDIIINAAAYTGVDAAEDNADEAWQVNAYAVQAVAGYAARRGALLLHYSADYVFAGAGDQPHDEQDPTGPLNVYGMSKRAGELAIAASGCRHLVLRTSWLHTTQGRDFVDAVLARAQARTDLNVVDDQVGAPTDVAWLVRASLVALTACLEDARLEGLYHLCSAGAVSRHAWAVHVLERAEAGGLALAARAATIRRVASVDYPQRARRPLNSRLSTRRFSTHFGLQPPDWREGVDASVAARVLRGTGRSVT